MIKCITLFNTVLGILLVRDSEWTHTFSKSHSQKSRMLFPPQEEDKPGELRKASAQSSCRVFKSGKKWTLREKSTLGRKWLYVKYLLLSKDHSELVPPNRKLRTSMKSGLGLGPNRECSGISQHTESGMHWKLALPSPIGILQFLISSGSRHDLPRSAEFQGTGQHTRNQLLGEGSSCKTVFCKVSYLLLPRRNASHRSRPPSPLSMADLLWYLK